MVLRDLNARTFGQGEAEPKRRSLVPAIPQPSADFGPRLSALEAEAEGFADLPEASFSARTRSSQASGTVSLDTSAVSLRAAGDEVQRCAPASPVALERRRPIKSAVAVMDVSTPRCGWIVGGREALFPGGPCGGADRFKQHGPAPGEEPSSAVFSQPVAEPAAEESPEPVPVSPLVSECESDEDLEAHFKAVLRSGPLRNVQVAQVAFTRVAEENAALRAEVERLRAELNARPADAATRVLVRRRAPWTGAAGAAARPAALAAALDRWAAEAVERGESLADWLGAVFDAGEVDDELVRAAARAVRQAERALVSRVVAKLSARLDKTVETQRQVERAALEASGPRRLAGAELARALRLLEVVARDLALAAREPGLGPAGQRAVAHAAALTQGLPVWKAHVGAL